ncbi:MAG: hypothetical protein RLZZ156_1457 [Deinococcota bacterium]|jgi:CRISPR-associated protein Csd2
MGVINNRYEFMLIFDCENGNPNGDPDTENLPRIDSQDGHGLVSDASLKRKIRDLVARIGEKIFVEHDINLNRKIFEAREKTGKAGKATKEAVDQAAKLMCETYFDVRTFGAVMSTGANAGQLVGPVQIIPARSVDPIHIMDWGITRVAVTETVKNAKSLGDYEVWEVNQPKDQLRTMGRKALIPYGLYVAKGFISAFDAENTGFSEDDLQLLFEALLNMFEHSRSGSRGMMSARKLVIFKHIGDAIKPEHSEQQAKLGRVPAHYLLDLGSVVSITRKDTNRPPRAFNDYTVTVDASVLPKGIEMLVLDMWDMDLYTNGWVSRPQREPDMKSKPPEGSRKPKST